jgi:Protein kinase domain
MSQPTNPNAGPPFAERPGRSKQRQDTVLLSDVPDAETFPVEPAAPDCSTLNLSSSVLAALGQRYDILAEAGHGSMGNVYKARDRETGETVALKLLKPEIASDLTMMERFKNELLFARKITHKNVCRVHEFNRVGGIAYTSMEFVEGESLRSVLNRFGSLPPRKAMDVAQQICSGLKEAHTQGIVHRDLKPENVMIDAQGNVKIMDFGIARSMEAVTRLTGSMVGTPAYMAPEQVAGKPVDYRTDIYSLGLMLYEIFTGAQAFHADTPVAVALKQLRESPPPPHEVEPSIPVPIERAILKCLEKESPKRFQSISELENALRSPATAPAIIPATHSGHAIGTLPIGALAAGSETKRTSPFAWVLLGALAVLAGLGGSKWMASVNAAQQIPPPARIPAPKPPEFALDIPVAQPAEAVPAETKKAAANPVTPATSKSKPSAPGKPASAEVSPRVGIAPAKKAADQPAHASPPQDAQQRAEKALGQAAAANGLTYLWVGRYIKEDKAQGAAKKIEDLGLPVVVIPKHGPAGQFFVVFAGPVGAKRVPSVMQWLEAQGFLNVRAVGSPNGEQNKKP